MWCAENSRRAERAAGVAALVRALPPRNRDMLRLVLRHLRKYVPHSTRTHCTLMYTVHTVHCTLYTARSPPASPQRGGAQRQEPDVVLQPGGVLRADAAAAGAGDRGLHPGPQVLQRAGGDAAGPLRADLRGRAAAARPQWGAQVRPLLHPLHIHTATRVHDVPTLRMRATTCIQWTPRAGASGAVPGGGRFTCGNVRRHLMRDKHIENKYRSNPCGTLF